MEDVIKSIKKLIKTTISNLIFIGIVSVIGLYVWGIYQDSRTKRTFTATFKHIDGLSKGVPVYALGAKVGKVIATHPMVNSDEVGLDILITKKGFPVPRNGSDIKIVPSLKRSGAKVIEISNIKRNGAKLVKGENTMPHDRMLRVLQEFYQISKDFATEGFRFLGSPTAVKFRKDFKSVIDSVINSVNQGTVKDDAKMQLAKLNDLIRSLEMSDQVVDVKDKQALVDRINALKKSLQSTVSVSDVYKATEKNDFR